MKKKWLAGVLSFILPGLGHLYLGRVQKGIILLLLNGIAIMLSSIIIGLFAMVFVWMYAIIDALKTADRINANNFPV
ncbi:sugar ABC transporter permease [Paenibacillus sp. KS1]|uniref:DUF6677 family protein n=1 Tax=Paenibacillus sp. KS1 TaxID=1849249 RepID=UPI0008065068|nr:DUF6677 family protein [Paenibacillus sp. KS1]OBY81579.1 sugar ABC transporter permease [Paenibacillus sp. KS1]